MSKYVEFDFNGRKPTYYKVDDFELTTIKNLPSYNSNWLGMIFLEGNKRMDEDKILDIYPAEVIKKIYYGKKLSYEKVTELVGNDLKYASTLEDMELKCRNAFFNTFIGNPSANSDDEEKDVAYKQFKEKYYKEHYCLFMMPGNFLPSALNEDYAMTIEEFDKEIKLDYDNLLQKIQSNAYAGAEYFQKNKIILNLFNNYFNMLIQSCKTYNGMSDLIFNSCYFNFEMFEGLETIEEINFFLDICDYTYGLSKTNAKLFNEYRKFINEKYKNLNEDNDISLN